MHVAVTNRDGGIVLVSIHGAIDINTAVALRDTMHQLLESGNTRVVVDLAGVDFCDSIGLGTFAYTRNHCHAAGGFLRLAAPTPFVARLLRTVGLTGPIPVHDTVAEALNVAPAV
ncbi:STAS domain-containing protein [Dactylosporangium sp. McL0621]|uniref:STAS domain-containing protein n=1 Tax=Dactylosporangium sp. McL0621 TaxID=3415678 RepID=UPI003CEA66EA